MKPKHSDYASVWRSKLLGRYHFSGPVSLRPINDYKANPLTLQTVIARFKKTLAAKMNGHSNVCHVRLVAARTSMWVFEFTVVRREPKIPERCSIPIPHRVVITYIPTGETKL